MRAAVLACVLVGCGVSGPDDVMLPTADEESAAFQAAKNVELERKAGETISVDLGDCANERLFAWLPFGSMWILVHRRDDDHCELWLGGETESPRTMGPRASTASSIGAARSRCP